MNSIYNKIFLILILPLTIYGQDDTDAQSGRGRTFMPEIQMGYVAHGTKELSGGLMTQTSVEYRDVSNFVFRINYDDFNANMNLEYPINPEVSYTGKTSFSELIGGIGYRKNFNKHNLIGYIQSGLRFYGYPVFNEDNNQVNIDFDNRNIAVMRYSIGYEYKIIPKLFFTIETLASHVLKSKGFWTNNKWSYGITIGISAPLF